MPILVIDGSEKSGKSTLAKLVEEAWPGPVWRKPWGPVGSDTEYMHSLIDDVKMHVANPGGKGLVIWDRSWASEHVYGLLLGRQRRLAMDPWLGEWLYGRAVQTLGVRLMVLANPAELSTRRDSTDLPVNPVLENAAFTQYALQFGWTFVANDYHMGMWQDVANSLVAKLQAVTPARGVPPTYCGPTNANVVVVGEQRNERASFDGAWLPLTSRLTIPLGRSLDKLALRVGWTNAYDCPPGPLRSAKHLIALGDRAETFCQMNVGNVPVTKLPHPAYLYRYGKARGLIQPAEALLRKIVEETS